jgi:hypothetical protein
MKNADEMAELGFDNPIPKEKWRMTNFVSWKMRSLNRNE